MTRYDPVEAAPPLPFEGVRMFLHESYQDASPDDIEAILLERFPELTPEQAEDFFGSIGKAFSSAGPVLQKAAPGILSGAVQGATTGSALGPWGALAGALAGGALGGYQSASRPSGGGAAPHPAAPGGNGRSAGGNPLAGLIGGGGGGNAAAQVLGLLNNPAVMQALGQMAFGSSGQRTVPVGSHQAPVANITGLLAGLLGQANAEYRAEIALADAYSDANPWDAYQTEALAGAQSPRARAIQHRRPEAYTDAYADAYESYDSAEFLDALEQADLAYSVNGGSA
jgi:hypothetical protein